MYRAAGTGAIACCGAGGSMRPSEQLPVEPVCTASSLSLGSSQLLSSASQLARKRERRSTAQTKIARQRSGTMIFALTRFFKAKSRKLKYHLFLHREF